ncbi:hypothetical protein Sjap_000087 [Stephania japonica]|uniref:Enoyl reductase (ER) domain-containing protein n=1 Tax=Stephania japonica TaxID=461633 RepID=A0AAP0KHE7_9MAGN
MKAVVVTVPGAPEVVKVEEVEDPKVAEGEVLIKVAASGLNGVDVLQRQGKYELQRGSRQFLGLECSGIVEAVGQGVSRWKIGDKVCALLNGGGYAEKVAVPAGQVLPIPDHVSLIQAACFPEVACTVWSAVFMTSKLTAGQTLLINGGSNGVAIFAIQMAKHQGARVIFTEGNAIWVTLCKVFGSDVSINFTTEDYVARVMMETGGKGVDVILDSRGANFFERNLECLKTGGWFFLLDLDCGWIQNLRPIVGKSLKVLEPGLRSETPETKAMIVNEVEKNVWPAIAARNVMPSPSKSFLLSEAAEAHWFMENMEPIDKTLFIVKKLK